MAKLEQNPYDGHIDMCEELIYFCAKTMRTAKAKQDAINGVSQEEEKKIAQQNDESGRI